MRLRPVLALAGLAVLVGTAASSGCHDRDTPDPAAATPSTTASTTASTPEAASVPEPLLGRWLVDLSRGELTADLEAAGFGAYADRFWRSEGLGRRAQLVLTVTAGRFEISFRQPDDSWKPGWWGPLREEDGVLTLHDDYFEVDDSFRWSREGDALRLDFAATTAGQIREIPSEAYSRAYFSRPLRAVECPPTDFDLCLPEATR